MMLEKITELVHYREIVDSYKRKGALSNDYLYQDISNLIIQGKLYAYRGANNAFLFVKKDECQRIYYYLNDLEEKYDFDMGENLVVEILFRGNVGLPKEELDFLSKCGFRINLRRDLYNGTYKDLMEPRLIEGVTVQKAENMGEVKKACSLFNDSFDHYSGDYICKEMAGVLYAENNIWIAKDIKGNFAGALHQKIDKSVAWISHVAVEKECRGHGVGQALIDTFVEHNKIDEKSKYMLWVQAQNIAAISMYKKKGFKYMNKSTLSMIKLNK